MRVKAVEILILSSNCRVTACLPYVLGSFLKSKTNNLLTKQFQYEDLEPNSFISTERRYIYL